VGTKKNLKSFLEKIFGAVGIACV